MTLTVRDRPGSRPTRLLGAGGRSGQGGLTPADRAGAFAGLDARHARFVDAARALPEADWERKADVFYGDAQDSYPTSPEDIHDQELRLAGGDGGHAGHERLDPVFQG